MLISEANISGSLRCMPAPDGGAACFPSVPAALLNLLGDEGGVIMSVVPALMLASTLVGRRLLMAGDMGCDARGLIVTSVVFLGIVEAR